MKNDLKWPPIIANFNISCYNSGYTVIYCRISTIIRRRQEKYGTDTGNHKERRIRGKPS
jgi:hypothetical protein